MLACASAQAQPLTTKPDASNILSTCLSNVPLVGSGSGNAPQCGGSGIANANLAVANAYTFKGNATGSSTTPQDFTISGLTHKSSPATTDLLIISDEASSHATKYTTIAEAIGSLASGVSSIDSKTGAFTTSGGITTATNVIQLANIGANTVLSNWTSGSAAPSANTWPACASDGVHALTYTNGTGVLCTATASLATKVVVTTYDLSTASGNKDITGFGFNPSSVIIHFSINGGHGIGSGWMAVDGTQAMMTTDTTTGTTSLVQDSSLLWSSDSTGTNYQICTGTFISDGIRLACTKAGSPTGTLRIQVFGRK